MRIYELLKTLFARPSQCQPSAAPASSSTAASQAATAVINTKRQAYLIEHLAEIEKEVALFWQQCDTDFNAFLYRPATANFIHQEILPLRNSEGQYNGFLDNSHWSKKHWLNFPGPFYTGDSDTCGTGDDEAPANVLYDAHCCEYVFRQPQSFAEFLCVLNAAAVEVLDSYSCDGNDYWTYALCREWWWSKSQAISFLSDPALQRTNGSRTKLYLDYLNGLAETDLRRYCYFLENGTYPTTEVTSLPTL